MTSLARSFACLVLVAGVVAVNAAGCEVMPDCMGVYIDANESKCTFEYDSCTDKHAYGAVCTNKGCTCEIDGEEDSTYDQTECPVTLEALNTACGWEIRE